MSKSILSSFLSVRAFLAVLVLIGFAGTLIGIWYYSPQISQLPASTWLFVMDSPLYALGVALVILAALLKIKLPNILKVIIALGSFQVGVWTVFVLLFYREWFFSVENAALFSAMFFLHIGQILEGFLLLPSLLPKKLDFVIAAAWFLFGDVLDYVFDLHPSLPVDASRLLVTAIFTFALSIAGVLLFLHAAKMKWKPFSMVPFLEKASDEIRMQS